MTTSPEPPPRSRAARLLGWMLLVVGIVVGTVIARPVPELGAPPRPEVVGGDTDGDIDDERCGLPSAASRWIDEALSTIRRDLPVPTVHARNLYHLSAAMWDAWAAWDDETPHLFVEAPVPEVEDVDAARAAAVAGAAHDVLVARYAESAGAEDSLPRIAALAAASCDGEAALAEATEVGRTVAAGVLAATADDGSAPVPPPTPVNPPLVVSEPGTTMVDPNRWQPLLLDEMVTQNGIAVEETLQQFVGWHWGDVTPFASLDWLAEDPPPGPPRLDDPDGGAGYREGALDVLRLSGQLDPADGVVLDAGPLEVGNNPLGSDDGTGHGVNPATGAPYLPNPVPRGDLLRVIAEYWADGPVSETPPGHWNNLARDVSDELAEAELHIGGTGPAVDRLEWDVTLFLGLNGALHDAAVAAWGVKAEHDSVRPISMIRYLAGLGQSSDPDGLAYDPDGLPLEEGLVEVATSETTAPGERHEGLAEHVGEVVVRTWAPREDDESDTPGVRWIPASTWVPYQQPTFVTPAFAGYPSGHSTFSRAGAEVLTAITGSEHFPGGIGRHLERAGQLGFEDGPSRDVELQWATYRDAADQAGRSRIAGGIHVPADDLAGRRLGATIGQRAWQRLEEFRAGG